MEKAKGWFRQRADHEGPSESNRCKDAASALSDEVEATGGYRAKEGQDPFK